MPNNSTFENSDCHRSTPTTCKRLVDLTKP